MNETQTSRCQQNGYIARRFVTEKYLQQFVTDIFIGKLTNGRWMMAVKWLRKSLADENEGAKEG